MLPGFNHNLRHRGVLFHIQTEDGGTKSPVVVTHVFQGGNIIATRRRSYEKFLHSPSVKDLVGSMMREQHKDMMKDLVHGRFRAVEEAIQHTPEAPTATTEEIGKPKEGQSQRPVKTVPTLDTETYADRTLDELIVAFLEDERQKKK